MTYAVPIKTAILLFPFIALLVTLPYMIYEYHKYGSIHKLRTVIVYSFILYMMAIYFLVILPLPDINTVAKPNESMRLVPFSFIIDFIKETTFRISEPSTYLKLFTEACFYVPVFNIIMTIPFGIYERYYFKRDLSTTTRNAFLLSLFFELTQLSGLYFIYPYPYRLFDIDDLILNTLGGIMGYFLSSIVFLILPTRKDIDKKSLEDGKKVTGLRRILIFIIDTCLCAFFMFISASFTQYNTNIIVFLIYYLLIPYTYDGMTLGSKFLNVKLEFAKFESIFYFLRIIFIYIYYFCFPYSIVKYSILLVNYFFSISPGVKFLIFGSIGTFLLTFYLYNLVTVLTGKTKIYDKILKTKYISTIKTLEE